MTGVHNYLPPPDQRLGGQKESNHPGPVEENCRGIPLAMYLDPLLVTLRETPQASTGLAPFELVFRQHPRRLIQVLQDG